ncbi:MAG: alpha/beta hydrolase [Armatimonadetes bacterium]|nr:alpha/beta hydrolase [Armatimonadota bacterium]
MLNYCPVCLLLLTALALGVQAASIPPPKPVLPPAPEGVIIRQDVSYLAPGREEKLDLYLPADRAKDIRSPAIVFIHGGGWVGGDKAEGRAFNNCTAFAQAGYVAVSINYTLERGKCWPTNLRDCKNAVRWLRVNADKYQIDAGHIGVIGGSAGGHLALMVAYTSHVPFLKPASPYPLVSDEVQCVVDLYGITNLLTRQKPDDNGTPTGITYTTQALMKRTRDEDPDAWKLGSPVYHVSKMNCPPTLILHGTADATVDRDQATELAKKLEEHGVEHQLIMIEGVGHTFDLQTWAKKPLPYDLRPIVVGFFDKHLKAKCPVSSRTSPVVE